MTNATPTSILLDRIKAAGERGIYILDFSCSDDGTLNVLMVAGQICIENLFVRARLPHKVSA